jgi:hypothetical protein
MLSSTPVILVPPTQSIAENSAITFSLANNNPISVADVDGSMETVYVQAASGTVALANTTGLTSVTGSGSNSLTMVGTLSAVDTALGAGLTYTPGSGYIGPDTVDLLANDNGVSSGTYGVSVAVNVPTTPVVTTPPTQTVAPGNSLVFSLANGTAFAISDPDMNAETVYIQTGSTNGTLSLGRTAGLTSYCGNGTSLVTIVGTVANLNNALDGLTFSASSSFTGAAPVDILAYDSSAPGSGDITVNVGSTPAPQIGVPPSQVAAENSLLVFSTANGNAITITDHDTNTETVYVQTDHGTLTLASTAGLISVWNNGTSLVGMAGTVANLNNALNGLTYAVASGYAGPATVSITATDNSTNGSNGVSVSVQVPGTPVIAVPGTQTVPENTSWIFSAGAGNAITIADPDQNVETAYVEDTYGTLKLGSWAGLTSVSGDGTSLITMVGSVANMNNALTDLTYTGKFGSSASDTVSVLVNNGGVSNSSGFGITITAAQAPVVADAYVTAAPGASATVSVLPYASDPDGDSLSLQGLTVPQYGKAVANSDGTMTYTPNPGYTGADYFHYTVTDNNGGTASATVFINSNGSSGSGFGTIMIYPDVMNVQAGEGVAFDPSELTQNGVDTGGSALNYVSITTGPSNGTLMSTSDGKLQYTPNAGFTGTDSFYYAISNANGNTAQGFVQMGVQQAAAAQYRSVTFSSDNTRVAVASSDGRIRVWSAETGQSLYANQFSPQSIPAIAFSPANRNLLAIAYYDNRASLRLGVLNIAAPNAQNATGQFVSNNPLSTQGTQGPLLTLAFSGNGLRLGYAFQNAADWFNMNADGTFAETPLHLVRPLLAAVRSLSFANNDTMVITTANGVFLDNLANNGSTEVVLPPSAPQGTTITASTTWGSRVAALLGSNNITYIYTTSNNQLESVPKAA